MEKTNSIKVVFIAGSERSGSTLLQNILGQISGYFAIGELHYLWDQLNAGDKYCSCGKLLLECEIWDRVFDIAFGGITNINLNEMVKYSRTLRVKNLPLLGIPRIRKQYEDYLYTYAKTIQKIYEGIFEVTNNNVIVESSKLPTFGVILQMIPNVQLHVIHLIRDSRAVAHSWMKKKSFVPDGFSPDFMVQKKPVSSAFQWMARNYFTETFMKKSVASYSFLQYEKMISDPQKSIQETLISINEANACLPFVSKNTVHLHKQLHSVAGNVSRFDKGEVKLVLDEDWKHKMNFKSRILVTSVSIPLLLRYKYPLTITTRR